MYDDDNAETGDQQKHGQLPCPTGGRRGVRRPFRLAHVVVDEYFDVAKLSERRHQSGRHVVRAAGRRHAHAPVYGGHFRHKVDGLRKNHFSWLAVRFCVSVRNGQPKYCLNNNFILFVKRNVRERLRG